MWPLSLASFIKPKAYEIQPCRSVFLVAPSFSLLSSTQLYGSIVPCLSILLLRDIGVISSLGIIMSRSTVYISILISNPAL